MTLSQKDICNSKQYDTKQDKIVSLVLFFDGANYTKSNKVPLHAFFSTISELPPLLRHSTRNIITHSLWTGSTPDFNIFFSRYNNELDNLLKVGIFIESLNLQIKVKCYVFIADAPERALVLNMHKFNGKYGCIMCMQEGGENVNKGSRGNNLKFTYKPNEMFARTEEKYLQQAHQSQIHNITVEGIKGPTYLSKLLPLPTSTIIDYMHASLLGTTKHLLSMWLSIKNQKTEFYLGSKINSIDKILIQVKYPIEFSRYQRSISENLNNFKASEYRNFLFYAGMPILKYFLPTTHYNHFVQYVIFMRLLCDTNCQSKFILLAYDVIVEYVKQFEVLYGQENMSFNLHSHLHFPRQVQRYKSNKFQLLLL